MNTNLFPILQSIDTKGIIRNHPASSIIKKIFRTHLAHSGSYLFSGLRKGSEYFLISAWMPNSHHIPGLWWVISGWSPGKTWSIRDPGVWEATLKEVRMRSLPSLKPHFQEEGTIEREARTQEAPHWKLCSVIAVDFYNHPMSLASLSPVQGKGARVFKGTARNFWSSQDSWSSFSTHLKWPFCAGSSLTS